MVQTRLVAYCCLWCRRMVVRFIFCLLTEKFKLFEVRILSPRRFSGRIGRVSEERLGAKSRESSVEPPSHSSGTNMYRR
jgi:hypothetical protein